MPPHLLAKFTRLGELGEVSARLKPADRSIPDIILRRFIMIVGGFKSFSGVFVEFYFL